MEYSIYPVLIRAKAGNYLVDCGYEEADSVCGKVKSERANESAEKIRVLGAKTIICYHGGVGDNHAN